MTEDVTALMVVRRQPGGVRLARQNRERWPRRRDMAAFRVAERFGRAHAALSRRCPGSQDRWLRSNSMTMAGTAGQVWD